MWRLLCIQELSQRKSDVVNNERLARVGDRLQLQRHWRVQREIEDETTSSGGSMANALADFVEALLGAVYLDSFGSLEIVANVLQKMQLFDFDGNVNFK